MDNYVKSPVPPNPQSSSQKKIHQRLEVGIKPRRKPIKVFESSFAKGGEV